MSKADNDKLLQAAIHEEITICPYDPTWSEKFAQEKARLMDIFSSDFQYIEHIGSTSVPGLNAKPIIDIMASVDSIQAADDLLGSLRDVGYVTPNDCNSSLTDRRWLMKHHNGHRTHHLHLLNANSEGWIRTIKFRNILRTNPEVAKAYLELKIQLAQQAGSDRDIYVSGKTPFVAETLKRFFYEKDPNARY